MTKWRWSLGVGATALLVLAVYAPEILAEAPAVGAAIYAGLSSICHQDPSRGFFVAGLPTALCARCLGVCSGAALAFLSPLRFSRKQLIGLLTLAVAAWLVEALAAGWPGELRFLAGTPLGIALAAPLAEASRRTVLC